MTKVKQASELIKDNLIVKHYAGSIAYGTNLPTSDVDYRGIFVADPINIRTPFFRVDECKDTTEEDTTIYELSQFCKLAADCNPNILESLFVDKSDIVFASPAYEHFRANSHLFLSAKIAFTTTGYAYAQLKRVKGHHKWINNPQPVKAPEQCKFISLVHNFTPEKIFKIDLYDYQTGYRLIPFSGDTYGVYPDANGGAGTFNLDTGNLNTTYDGNSDNLGTPLFIIKFNKSEYNTAKDYWSNYWTWKQNRNVARNELEEKFGYDSKHAMHLVRLMRIGEEVLTVGEYRVKRPDAAELLDIRNGKWTYEELLEYAEDMDNRIKNVLYKQTTLPKTPDIQRIARLIMDVQEIVWK
jgi:hypothetical protein